jgi:hypothetical protein
MTPPADNIIQAYWWDTTNRNIFDVKITPTPVAAVTYSLETKHNVPTFYEFNSGAMNWATGFPSKQKHCEDLKDLRVKVTINGHVYYSNTFKIQMNDVSSSEYQFFNPPLIEKRLCVIDQSPLDIDLESNRVINVANVDGGDTIAWVITLTDSTLVSIVDTKTLRYNCATPETKYVKVTYTLTRKNPVWTYQNQLEFNIYADSLPPNEVNNNEITQSLSPSATSVIVEFDTSTFFTSCTSDCKFTLINQPRNPSMEMTLNPTGILSKITWTASQRTPSSKYVTLRVAKMIFLKKINYFFLIIGTSIQNFFPFQQGI